MFNLGSQVRWLVSLRLRAVRCDDVSYGLKLGCRGAYKGMYKLLGGTFKKYTNYDVRLGGPVRRCMGGL